jgi:hypothetical protein
MGTDNPGWLPLEDEEFGDQVNPGLAYLETDRLEASYGGIMPGQTSSRIGPNNHEIEWP